MKKACLTWLALYAAIAIGGGWLVHRRWPIAEAAIGAGVVGGFFVWLGVAYLSGIRRKVAEARMIRRAINGQSPRDGEKIAAIGRISALGATATSPFTRTPCVAYGYTIEIAGKKTTSKLYEGFALVPSSIHSGSHSIRLLAYPDLKVRKESTSGPVSIANAVDYIQKTTFRQPRARKLREAFGEWMAQFNDDDGSVRIDDHWGDQEPDLQKAQLFEQLLRPGDQVCAIGRYSAQRGGIVPDPKSPLEQQVVVKVGEQQSFTGGAMRGAIGYFLGGAFLLTAAAAAIVALFVFVRLDTTEGLSPAFDPSWLEIRMEQLLEQRVRVPLHEAGFLDSPQTLSTLPTVEARGRIRAGGKETRITSASAQRAVRDGDTTILFDDDEKAVLVVGHDLKPKSLRFLGREIDPGSFPESLEVLLFEEETQMSGRINYSSEVDQSVAGRIRFRAFLEKPEEP